MRGGGNTPTERLAGGAPLARAAARLNLGVSSQPALMPDPPLTFSRDDHQWPSGLSRSAGMFALALPAR